MGGPNPLEIRAPAEARRRERTANTQEKLAKAVYYGLGINVRAVKGGLNLWHGGSLPGTSTFALRTADGYAWVAAFNGRPEDRSGFRRELDRGLWEARGKVGKWPDGDLFAERP